MASTPELVLRDGAGDRHHLFDNHGTWWVRACVRLDPALKPSRFAASLRTGDLDLARRRRDAFLDHLARHPDDLAGARAAAWATGAEASDAAAEGRAA